jgi:two-component system phosphate regulon sensor histidine kinase PhoR
MKSERSHAERLVIFLLLPAIVLAVLVLSSFSLRASFQLEKLREQSVVEATLELANERAARLDQRLIEQDDFVATEVDVANLDTLATIGLPLALRQTPTVRAVLVIDLSGPQREVVAFASRAPGLEDDELRRLLVHELFSELELNKDPVEQLRHLHANRGEHSYLLGYWQRKVFGRRFLVLVWHDVARIVHDIMPQLYSERDSQSRVNVVDADGRIVFGPPLGEGEFTVGRAFQTTLYKWRLNVALTSAKELAAGAARRRMIETGLSVLSALVVIAGVLVILIAVYRERKLSELKSELVANVSHELKTPLSLVRMFGEMLATGRVENEEKRRQYLQIVVAESERLGGLIENVLDFARVERGKAAFDFAPAELGPILLHAVDLCRPRAEHEGIALEGDVEQSLPLAVVDQRSIEVAAVNLLDNAIKYGGSGKVVRLSLTRRGNLLSVCVADCGVGIAEEDRRRIFERFVRGKKVGSTRGSGIGLALVRQIARAHGGDAWVEPNEPQGSRFYFTVRVAKS